MASSVGSNVFGEMAATEVEFMCDYIEWTSVGPGVSACIEAMFEGCATISIGWFESCL